jgi:hypothetical protein
MNSPYVIQRLSLDTSDATFHDLENKYVNLCGKYSKDDPKWTEFDGGSEYLLWLVRDKLIPRHEKIRKIKMLLDSGYDPFLMFNFIKGLVERGFKTDRLGSLRIYSINPLEVISLIDHEIANLVVEKLRRK